MEPRARKTFTIRYLYAKKESKETLYWLELAGETIDEESLIKDCKDLSQETKEFILIFGKIAYSLKE